MQHRMTLDSITKRLHAPLAAAGAVSLVIAEILSAALAAPAIPSLVGTWSVQGKGGVLCKVEASRCKTHHHGEFGDLNAVAQITKQQGRVFHGVFKSRYASEQFVGTLAHDSSSVHLVDEDGFADGKITGPNQMQFVYRHTTDLDVVVDWSTWTRR